MAFQGSMNLENFRELLNQCFPWKESPAIETLINAAVKDNGGNNESFEHKSIFKEVRSRLLTFLIHIYS